MAPFRLNHDELEYDLPWRLMQNGPVTLYWRREYFEDDIQGLRMRGFRVPTFDCRGWTDELALHEALRIGLRMPEYTGRNFDALNDSLAEIEVPEESGLMVALDARYAPPPVGAMPVSWNAREFSAASRGP